MCDTRLSNGTAKLLCLETVALIQSVVDQSECTYYLPLHVMSCDKHTVYFIPSTVRCFDPSNHTLSQQYRVSDGSAAGVPLDCLASLGKVLWSYLIFTLRMSNSNGLLQAVIGPQLLNFSRSPCCKDNQVDFYLS